MKKKESVKNLIVVTYVMKNLFMKTENEKDNEYKKVRDRCQYTGK